MDIAPTRGVTATGMAITPPPSIRGPKRKWARQKELDTCGVEATDLDRGLVCRGDRTCATAPTAIGTALTQTRLFVFCCELSEDECTPPYTACIDSSDVGTFLTSDPNALTCTAAGSTLCQTWSWVSDGALGFGCGRTGGVIPILPEPTLTTSSTTSTGKTTTRATTPGTASPTDDAPPTLTGGVGPSQPGYSAPLNRDTAIGIAVGVGLPVVIVICLGIFLVYNRRQRKKAAAQQNTQPSLQGTNAAVETKHRVATW
ncbi:hypothetical protein VTJ83DRAFT_3794 [Remersonia thermophila]|uniref:Uncharacterized protein n=1 Tax=Remersonia thermophila TaxID=72144 RepID=A0ABR4DEZ7_9PEZI